MSSDERRKLVEQYGQPVHARAAIARAAAGLVIVIGIAAAGGSHPDDAPGRAAGLSAKQAVSGR